MRALSATLLGVTIAAALTCSPALAENFVFHCNADKGHCVWAILHNNVNHYVDIPAGGQQSTGDFTLGDLYYVAAIPVDPKRGCQGVTVWCYGPRHLMHGVNT